MIFNCLDVKSMGWEFITETIHSKYGFIGHFLLGCLSIFYIKYICYFILKKFYYVY